MASMTSKLIALEGGEGVGKTTQMNLLKERLPQLFPERDFVFTREPGGTTFSDKIRELILSEDAKEADGRTMFGLFVAARAEHVRRIIDPALDAGKTIVTDRYVAATFAYQVVAQEHPMPEHFFAEYLCTIPRPSLTVILDLDPAIARARAAERTTQALTHFDSRPLEFYVRLQHGYRKYANRYDNRAVIIDANAPVEMVHERIIEAFRKA